MIVNEFQPPAAACADRSLRCDQESKGLGFSRQPWKRRLTDVVAAGDGAVRVAGTFGWEFGYPEADFSFAPNTFAVLTTSPQVAQAYLPTLTYFGRR
ncbi:MAG TPA: hypothetical protein VK767_08865 [Bradyrhizobium sp.]|nr:hypothetical protein [Bradyrhizobium sp.]